METLVELLTQEAIDKGFRADNINGIITIWLLNRKVHRSEIIEALDLHEHEMFVTQKHLAVQINLS